MGTLVKILNIPTTLRLKYDSDVWDLLGSDAFSKLCTGQEKALTESELNYLRKEFTKFAKFAERGDHSYDERYAVPKNEPITISMMQKASVELARIAANA